MTKCAIHRAESAPDVEGAVQSVRLMRVLAIGLTLAIIAADVERE